MTNVRKYDKPFVELKSFYQKAVNMANPKNMINPFIKPLKTPKKALTPLSSAKRP